MNTKLIKNTSVTALPHLPELDHLKANRVITKHFTNCALSMRKWEYSLLNWLIYQSEIDNTFNYSTRMLNKYIASIKAIEENLSCNSELGLTLLSNREVFRLLIMQGYILPFGGRYMINPMLTYHVSVSNKKYKEVMKNYSIIIDWSYYDINWFCQEYQKMFK